VIIPYSQYKEDLQAIPNGTKVSVFGMDLETVSQMAKGRVMSVQKSYMVIDIDSVYNSMPPKMGNLYPIKQTSPKITEFV